MKMQRIIIWILVILFLLTLQSTIVPRLSILGASPNLVVAAVMVLAIWHGRMAGIWGGFVTGLLMDMWAPQTMGLQALALTLTGAFTALFESKKMNSGPLFQFFFFVIGSVLYESVNFYSIAAETEVYSSYLLGSIIPRALFTALFGIFFATIGDQLNPHGRR